MTELSSNWNLPPGCTLRDIERACGDGVVPECAYCDGPLKMNNHGDYPRICEACRVNEDREDEQA